MKRLAVVCFLSMTAALSLAQGAVVQHYWNFDGADQAADKVGTLSSGTVGTPDYDVDYGNPYTGSGDAFQQTDGVFNNYVTAGSAGDVDFGTSSFSISFWYYDDSINDSGDTRQMRVLDCRDVSGSGIIVCTTTSEINVAFVDHLGNESIGNIDLPDDLGLFPTNQWVHVSITVDRDTADLASVYVNGSLNHSFSLSVLTGNIVGSDLLEIGVLNGGDTTGEVQPGALDDLAFYTGVLSSAEITGLAAGTITPDAILGQQVEPVEIVADPNSVTVQAGSDVSFEVQAINADTYQWEKDDVDLIDGLQADGSTVAGAQTSILTIDGVTKDSEGGYTCLVSNPASSVSSTEARLMTKRLVAFWQFENNLVDDEDGWQGVYVDAGNPTATPTPVYTAGGLQGQSLVLQDDDLHVQIDGSEDYFNFLDAGMTVIAWMKSSVVPDTTSYLPGTSGWDLGYNDQGYASMDTMNVEATATRPNPYVTAQSVFDGQWHMVAGTYDAAEKTTRVFVDGQLIASESDVYPAADSTGPVVIGAADIVPDSKPFDGLIDNVSIYSYPLTPIEIAQQYVNLIGGAVCSDLNADNIVYDFNHDCTVNIEDFAVLAQAWGTNDPLYDLVVDGEVNLSDLAVFISEWLNTAIVE